MSRYRFLIILSMISVCGMVANAAVVRGHDYAGDMLRSQGRAWSEEKVWDYVPGLVTKSILLYTEQYPDSALSEQAYRWCKKYADSAIDANGNFYNFKKGSLDNIASGKVLLSLYKHEEALKPGSGARYKAAADYLYRYLRYEYPRITQAEGQISFIHKDRYPYQIWLDGLYMGAAFYAEYVSMFMPDDHQAWSDIATQFYNAHDYTYDKEKKLNYHAWSAVPSDPNSFWARRTSPHKGCSPEFWGRGMGWYFAALADVLEFMPQDQPDFPFLEEIYIEVAEGLLARQDQRSGVWYQLLQYDDSFVSAGGRHNYLEASASCMFTYAFLKGMRLMVIPRSVYLDATERAYSGVLDTFITAKPDGNLSIGSICRSAGLGPASDPSRDGTADYYLDGRDVEVVSDEGKGIGSFILASLEYQRMHIPGRTDLHSVNLTVTDDPSTSMAFCWMTPPSISTGMVQIVDWEGGPSDWEEGRPRPDTSALQPDWGSAIEVEAQSMLTPELPYINLSNEVEGADINLLVRYTSHKACVDGLQPSTTYVYRVGNEQMWSDIGCFKTAPDNRLGGGPSSARPIDQQSDYGFIYITDTQAQNAEMFDVSARTVHAATSLYPDATMVMCLGDLIESRGDYCSEWEYEQWFSTMQDVWMRYPLAVTQGNHDKNPHKNFVWHFNNDNSFNQSSPVTTDYDGTVYSFEVGDVLYMILNFEDYAKSGYLDALAHWMRGVVDRSQCRWRVVGVHRPVFSGGRSHQDDAASRAVRDKLLPVFAELDIDVVLQGHDHIYEVIGPVDNLSITPTGGVKQGELSAPMPSYATYDVSVGTLYFLNGSAGQKKYEVRTRPEMEAAFSRHGVENYWDLFTGALLEQSLPSFSYVSVAADTLTFTTYCVPPQADPYVFDAFSVVKSANNALPLVSEVPVSIHISGSTLEAPGATSISLYTLTGALVTTISGSRLDISALPHALYLVALTTPSGHVTLKSPL